MEERREGRHGTWPGLCQEGSYLAAAGLSCPERGSHPRQGLWLECWRDTPAPHLRGEVGSSGRDFVPARQRDSQRLPGDSASPLPSKLAQGSCLENAANSISPE